MAAIIEKPQPKAVVDVKRETKESQGNSKLKTSKSTPAMPASKVDKKGNKYSLFGSKKKSKKELEKEQKELEK